MAKIFTKIDGDDKVMILDNSSESLWMNYHVTKHVIINNKQEGFHNIFNIDIAQIEEIKEIQKNEYNCSVNKLKSQKETCNQCLFINDCNKILNPMIELYSELIEKSFVDDVDDPTHAHYEKSKSSSSKKLIESILFIDKNGTSIIGQRRKNNYFIITCYRNLEFSNLSDIQLAFRKVLDDSAWIKRMNIDEWNKRLKYRKFQNVDKHLSENWI
jgi:hypothetical protein